MRASSSSRASTAARSASVRRGRAAGAGAVGQAGEALGPEARDELAHRLLVEAEGAGGLGDRRAVGDGLDDPQPLVLPPLGGAGAQAAVQFGTLGRRSARAG